MRFAKSVINRVQKNMALYNMTKREFGILVCTKRTGARLPKPSRSAKSVCTHSNDGEHCELIAIASEFADGGIHMLDYHIAELVALFRVDFAEVLKVMLANESRHVPKSKILNKDIVDQRLKSIYLRFLRGLLDLYAHILREITER